MTKQTSAHKKAAAAKMAAQTTKSAATPPVTQAVGQVTNGATTQPNAQSTPSNAVVTSATPSLIDQAVAFSMGEIVDQTQAQAAFDLWDAMGCEALPPKLAVAIFDCAHGQGAKVCERLLGKVGITRDEDQFDISAVEDRAIDDVVRDLLAWRLRRYAFTASAATKMLEWSQHILALQALTVTEPEA